MIITYIHRKNMTCEQDKKWNIVITNQNIITLGDMDNLSCYDMVRSKSDILKKLY